MDKQREYQRICQKLTESLLKDEMAAILVQLKIDRATRSTVTDGRKFIDVLEMREVIGVGNFHQLVPLLRDHELDQMAQLLEKYMTDYDAGKPLMTSEALKDSAFPDVTKEGAPVMCPASIQVEQEIAAIEASFICAKHKTRQEVICLTCYVQVCYACAYLDHQDHEVVSMDELQDSIQDQTKEVQSEIRKMEEQLHHVENVKKILEEKIHQPVEVELQYFVEENLEAMQAQQKRLIDAVNYIAELGVTDLERTKMALSDVDNVIFLTEEEINAKLYPDNLTKLCEINKIERQLTESENSMNETSHFLQEGSMEILIRPTSISAKLAHISHGCILGAVMANAEQMVVIRSQSKPSSLINVTCTSCYDPKILFWEYTFECNLGPYPIVAANTLHISPTEMGILIGCGGYVTLLQVSEPNDLLFFVKIKRNIDVNIPNDSHITGLSPITGKMQDAGIIVSDEKSGKLQIFDNKYQLTKKVALPGCFPLITCVFRSDAYKYAVAALNSKSVELVTTNTTEKIPRKFGSLCSAQNSTLHPQSLFFDGSFFTVLWVSGEETHSQGQIWKVIAYKIDGEECNVSKAGKCEPNIIAVSISHVKNDTLLCFSNGTVEMFQTYKT